MFKENFKRICADRGVAPTKVLEEIGIGKSNYSEWNDNSLPRNSTLLKLADYFNLTVDELLHGEQTAIPLNAENTVKLPVYESVSAGFGLTADNTVTEYLPVYLETPQQAEEYVCFKVSGDSMFPKIEDGDTVLVHKQTSVDNNSVAVLLIDGEEGIIKKVEYGTDFITLHSINPMFQERKFSGQDVTRVRVLGQVKKVIKTL